MEDHVMSDRDSGDEHLLFSTVYNDDLPITDVSSILSDPPSDVDIENDRETRRGQPLRRRSLRDWKTHSQENILDKSTTSESEQDEESEFEKDFSEDGFPSSNSEVDWSVSLGRCFSLKVESVVSKFERLPYEILQKIATLLPSDFDLISLILTCHTFARQLQPENSSIWKTRFLRKYDHPIVEGPFEFRIAYQLRAIVLPRFPDFAFDTKERASILLNVLRDMVLETYNKPNYWHNTPEVSANMGAFSDAMKSTWMVHFLLTPFLGRGASNPFGFEHELFDTLQVALSYLVLNRGAMAFQVSRERSDYDLIRVYNYDQACAMLYNRLLADEPKSSPPRRSTMFPNLQKRIPTPKFKFELEMHTVLHIRNFWHRHLTEMKAVGGEETYTTMAASLGRIGISPKAWTRPLQDPVKLQIRWYGHYSCVYPWPKTIKLLRNKESEAEVWDSIDPLCLDISGSSTNINGAWPDIFAEIPAFEKTLVFSQQAPQHGTPTFIRGLAPFQIIEHIKHAAPQHTLSPQHHHPFTRLRLRGIVHPIADQADIPGWQRVVFVLYKPTYRSLSEVFDHATEWFGEPFQQHLNNALGPSLATMAHEDVEAQYRDHLVALLQALKGPLRMDRALIEAVEDAYSDPGRLSWADIDLAYAYEGVITPGGKIMLGRWWRVGPPGPLGQGEGQEYGNPLMGYERGPFVFWSET